MPKVFIEEKPAVLILGNLSDGFTFVGPFDSFDEAAAASENYTEMSWVATLITPTKVEP